MIGDMLFFNLVKKLLWNFKFLNTQSVLQEQTGERFDFIPSQIYSQSFLFHYLPLQYKLR